MSTKNEVVVTENENSLLKEVEYWKNKAEEYSLRLTETTEEFEEFTASSKDLERELEEQLTQQEKDNRKLLKANEKIQIELDNLRSRYEAQCQDMSVLQEEALQLRKDVEQQKRMVRQLEQINDDLERCKRQAFCSIEDFETKLNDAIERNVFLQGEKDELVDRVQREKDEIRDLQQELQHRLSHLQSLPQGHISDIIVPVERPLSPKPPLVSSEVQTETGPHSKNLGAGAHVGGNGGVGSEAMSPALRVNALNVVSNLMRKVGGVECRIAQLINSPDAKAFHHAQRMATSMYAGGGPVTPLGESANSNIMAPKTPLLQKQ